MNGAGAPIPRRLGYGGEKVKAEKTRGHERWTYEVKLGVPDVGVATVLLEHDGRFPFPHLGKVSGQHHMFVLLPMSQWHRFHSPCTQGMCVDRRGSHTTTKKFGGHGTGTAQKQHDEEHGES